MSELMGDQKLFQFFHHSLLAISPLILGIRIILLLQSSSPTVLDQEPTNTLAELCRRLKILRPVRLLETEQSIVPMTWGLLSSVVIVPASWRDRVRP